MADANFMRVDLNEVDWIEYTDKGRYKPPIIIDKLVMSILEFEPGYSPPLHTHEDEQITYVLSGVLEIDVEDRGIKRYEYVTEGQAMAIAPYAPHKLTGVEAGRAVEIWSPGLRHRAAEEHYRLGKDIVIPRISQNGEYEIIAEGPGHTVPSRSSSKS